jgi:single-strand DNA-binding protein
MGRSTRDPEIRYGANSNAVASFSIAVDRRFKREGQPDADFFNCVAFGKTADFCEKYIKKGTKVVIDGEIQNNNYTNKDGQEVRTVQIIANSIEFAESKNNQQGNQQKAEPQNEPTPNDFLQIPDNVAENLPF